MNTTNTPKFTSSDLSQFFGSENQFRDRMTGLIYTDGCQFLAKNGCGWLISDALIICKMQAKVKREEFVLITFKRQPSGKCVVSYEDGNGRKLFSQTYPMSDCPVDEIKLYFTNGVLCLSSEG